MGCFVISHDDRLYCNRSPREKFQCYRDYGSPSSTNHAKIQLLAGHIYKIICFIDQHKWKEANTALNRVDVARSCGIRIDSPFKVLENHGDAVSFVLKKAMFVCGNLKITLPQVAIGKKGSPEQQWKYPEEDPDLAMRIFPIWLEEWIHAFQCLIAGPVSEESLQFKKSPRFQNSWSVNEVDIYAIYRDLDWDKDMLLEMENRYDERIAFANHQKEEKMGCCCKKMFS